MFEWFFGNNNTFSNYSRVQDRCELLLKSIRKTRIAYVEIMQYSKGIENPDKSRKIIAKQIEVLKERLKEDILLCKSVADYMSKLNLEITQQKVKIEELKQFLRANKIFDELGNITVMIKVLNYNFTELNGILKDITDLDALFDYITHNKASIKSISADYFNQEVLTKITRLYNTVDMNGLEEKHAIINSIDTFLQSYIVELKGMKTSLNKYYYEFTLIEKLVQQYKKGLRGSELMESVFGKSQMYDFHRVPQTNTELLNNLFYKINENGEKEPTMMDEDTINRVMHKLGFRPVADANFMTRGISDRDAKRFFNSIKDLAGAYGIVQNKDKTIDGFGLIHISEHYSKLIDVINPKYSSIKEALEETVKNPKFTVRSKESKLYINPLGNDGRFFLLAVFHVSGLFVTFYHVDDSSDGLINTIKMMVLRKNANFYKHNTENDYYMVSFFSNDKYTYIIKYKKKDAIVYINAEKMTKPQFELLSTEFIQDKDIPEADKNCFKNFYENNKKRVINLAALAA